MTPSRLRPALSALLGLALALSLTAGSRHQCVRQSDATGQAHREHQHENRPAPDTCECLGHCCAVSVEGDEAPDLGQVAAATLEATELGPSASRRFTTPLPYQLPWSHAPPHRPTRV